MSRFPSSSVSFMRRRRNVLRIAWSLTTAREANDSMGQSVVGYRKVEEGLTILFLEQADVPVEFGPIVPRSNFEESYIPIGIG